MAITGPNADAYGVARKAYLEQLASAEADPAMAVWKEATLRRMAQKEGDDPSYDDAYRHGVDAELAGINSTNAANIRKAWIDKVDSILKYGQANNILDPLAPLFGEAGARNNNALSDKERIAATAKDYSTAIKNLYDSEYDTSKYPVGEMAVSPLSTRPAPSYAHRLPSYKETADLREADAAGINARKSGSGGKTETIVVNVGGQEISRQVKTTEDGVTTPPAKTPTLSQQQLNATWNIAATQARQAGKVAPSKPTGSFVSLGNGSSIILTPTGYKFTNGQ